MYLIFFTIGLSLVPAVGVLAILSYIGFGLYGGIFCAIEGYKYNIGRGIVSIWQTIHICDKLSNNLIFRIEKSCFPDCKDTCKTKKTKKPKNKKDSDNKEENSSNIEAIPEEKEETPTNEEQKYDEEQKSQSKKEEPEIKEDNSPKNEESENKKALLSNEQ